ncbi:MAG: bifunctional pyr operon transcriptional regulator/uracil phosphoribosyltransferase PyrR [Burkholderiales bacterium]|jgi:pyrimidine operon attenuation protein/uracil phosphoribosyltransferase|nr:bifunctional pyr operon transcriptional regulator/uracil phosphoribosyltransferase PyrR [Burkholderiales bacterium]
MSLHLDAEQIYRAFAARLREETAERDIRLVGIVSGGAWIAERLARDLGVTAPVGALDVSFYRDDFARQGLKSSVKPSHIPFDVQGADIVLVDDVLFTGRTVRAAMNELFDYGRPARIELAALIDRGGRELPIAPRVVGRTIEVPAEVKIELSRADDGRFALTLEQASA